MKDGGSGHDEIDIDSVLDGIFGASRDEHDKKAEIALKNEQQRLQLEADAYMNEHNRHQKFREHFEKIAIALLYIAALSFTAMWLVWMWHLIAPDAKHYLTDAGRDRIENLILAGAAAGFIIEHFKKRLK